MTGSGAVCPECGESEHRSSCSRVESETTELSRPAPDIAGFKILRLVGEGGMGGVFLAEDSTLGRRVAIKLVSGKTSGDSETRERFLREARALARVEHPNVVRIYSFGEERTSPYIVMEFIEGESLADRLRRVWKPSIDEALSITIQVTDALEAVWAKGVVHRDVKPSNILLDRSGRAHVADFGLAKPIATEDSALTSTGAIVGTPHYISPEQARGERLDFRADVYSLGIVLYEMLAGERPFKGATPASIVAQHLYQPLPSLRHARQDLPAAVVELVGRMTDKDPARRPASYAELRATLEGLATHQPRAAERHPFATGFPKSALLAIGGGVASVAVIASVLLLTMNRRPGDPTDTVTVGQIEKITNRGTVSDAVLSPDGRYIAYLSRESGEKLLWLKDVSEGTEVRLVGPLEPEFPSLDFFSSDSRYVYYTQLPKEKGFSHLFRIPVIGGQSRLVAQGHDARLSPDGAHLLYRFAPVPGVSNVMLFVSKGDGSAAKQVAEGEIGVATWLDSNRIVLTRHSGSLAVVDVELAKEREVPKVPSDYDLASDLPPSCRSGSDEVAAVFRARDGTYVIRMVDLRNGAARALGGHWHNVDSVQWLPDGSALIVRGSLDERGPYQIWLVPYPDGARKAITPESGEYDGAVITPDGKRLVATQTVERSDVVVSTGGGSSALRRILTGTDVDYSLCWTMKGEIVVSSNENGTYDLYALQPESGNRRQLTFDSTGDERAPAASPDGRYVVFVSDSVEGASVWRIGLDGTALVRLTPPAPHNLWIRPHVSPDGKWILFQDWNDGPQISMVPIDGGTPRVVKGSPGVQPSAETPKEYAFGGAWSPRGTELAFFYFTRAEAWSPTAIAISSPEGLIRKKLPYAEMKGPAVKDGQHLQWSPDGQHLYFAYYVRDGNLWKQPVAGGPPTRVTSEDLIGDFDWSPDGKSLAFSRVTSLRDIVLISNFR